MRSIGNFYRKKPEIFKEECQNTAILKSPLLSPSFIFVRTFHKQEIIKQINVKVDSLVFCLKLQGDTLKTSTLCYYKNKQKFASLLLTRVLIGCIKKHFNR